MATRGAKRAQRLKLFRRQKGLCGLCGKPMSYLDFSRDHIIPQSWGGTYKTWNMRAAHYECNWARGDDDENSTEMREAQRMHVLMGYPFRGEP